MIHVKVLKFAGETGLRQPGSKYFELDARAQKLKDGGFVDFVETTFKEEKTVIETKELKNRRSTKKRK